jgi:hypothetical protein
MMSSEIACTMIYLSIYLSTKNSLKFKHSLSRKASRVDFQPYLVPKGAFSTSPLPQLFFQRILFSIMDKGSESPLKKTKINPNKEV